MRFGGGAHAMAIGLQREQHGERREVNVVMTVMAAGVMAMAVAMIVVIMGMTVMMTAVGVVAMVPAVMGAAVFLRLAFIQLKRLAHTDVVFAHM